MLVGHYSVAFAVKSDRNKIPLWILFVAVQLLDFLWAPLVLLGIEKVRIIPGITASSPFDLYYMPYTHSWSGRSSGPVLPWYYIESRRAQRFHAQLRLIVAFAVFSHWILDLIVHRPDLAIYDDTLKVDFGLWNYRGLEFGLGTAILVVGIFIYLKRNTFNSVARQIGVIIFGVVLILIQAGSTLVGRPLSSGHAIAVTALIFYTLFAGVAFLLEKLRKEA
jgi:hypothetical protein